MYIAVFCTLTLLSLLTFIHSHSHSGSVTVNSVIVSKDSLEILSETQHNVYKHIK